MFIKIFVLALLTLAAQYIIRFGLVYFGFGNTSMKHYPGQCQQVKGLTTQGSEDFTLLPSGQLIVTSGLVGFEGKFDYSQNQAKGQIYVMDTNKDTTSLEKLVIKGYPADAHFEPLGVDHWVHKNKSVSIFLVLHAPERIARFLYDGERTLTLTKVYENSTAMKNVNSVVATSEDSFYFTNIFYARYGVKFLTDLEYLLRMPGSDVVHVRGDDYMTAADGLPVPNGMAMDTRHLYLAIRDGINIYTRGTDHSLTLLKHIAIARGTLDNVKLDTEGNLWIGSVDTLKEMIAYQIDSSTAHVHSTVIRVRDPTGEAELESVFADDSSLITAISVAVYTNGKLLIGSIRDSMVSCDVHYLSSK